MRNPNESNKEGLSENKGLANLLSSPKGTHSPCERRRFGLKRASSKELYELCGCHI